MAVSTHLLDNGLHEERDLAGVRGEVHARGVDAAQHAVPARGHSEVYSMLV